MEEIPNICSEKGEAIKIVKLNPLLIVQNEIKFELNIEINKNKITFCINDKSKLPSINYIRTMNLDEIKELNGVFYILNSFKDFYDYLKSLSDSEKLNIKKSNDKLSLIFYVEVLLKQQKIEIDLFPTKSNIDLNIKEIYQELSNINLKIDTLKKENNELKNLYDNK